MTAAAPDLFAHAAREGERLKRNGMALASAAQHDDDPTWMDEALAALKSIAERQATVHVDDFLRAFARRPAHHNANATLWRKAKARGFIGEEVGRAPCRVDPLKRAHLSPVYRSKLFIQQAA